MTAVTSALSTEERAMLPEKVLKQAQAELLEYGDSGQSVMEMSHRSKWFDAII